MKNIKEFDDFINENYYQKPDMWTAGKAMINDIIDGASDIIDGAGSVISDTKDAVVHTIEGGVKVMKDWFGGSSNMKVAIDGNGLIMADKIANMLPDAAEQRAFKSRLVKICGDLGIQPNWLLWVIYKESQFKPHAKNPNSSATGLLQMIESSARGVGTSTAALSKMHPTEQLTYVYKYLKGVGASRCRSVEELYILVFSPAAFKVIHQPDAIALKRSKGNEGVDGNKDGKITTKEFRAYAVSGMPEAYKKVV